VSTAAGPAGPSPVVGAEEPGRAVPGVGNSGVSPSRIAVLLGREITPTGKSAKVATLLRTSGFTINFNALEAGRAVIDWYQLPPGATLAGKSRAKPILVASGQMSFSRAGTAKIKIKLTRAGKNLLKRTRRLKLTAKCTFTPTGAAPVTVTEGFVLSG
jgi:hypothetical protein